MVFPTLRPGTINELVRILPEGIALLPLFNNIHLGTKQAIKSVKADLSQRPNNWLKKAVRRMTEITERDWATWRR